MKITAVNFADVVGTLLGATMFLMFVGGLGYAIYDDLATHDLERERTAARRAQVEDAKRQGLIREVTPGLWAIKDPVTGATCYAESGWLGGTLKNCVVGDDHGRSH